MDFPVCHVYCCAPMHRGMTVICSFIAVGWGTDQRGFGEEPGMKTQIITLIRSIRTVMRSKIIKYNVMIVYVTVGQILILNQAYLTLIT